MAKSNRHIIQKQFFNLTLHKSKDSAVIQQKVSSICKEEMTPLLNEVFNRLVKEDELFKIDKLEIDIGYISPDELEKVLSEKIANALEEKIRKLISSQSLDVSRSPLNINHFEAWLVYLTKGILPWQLGRMEEADIRQSVLESLASNSASILSFRETILSNPQALERLVKQSEETFLIALLKACFGSKASPLSGFRKTFQTMVSDAPAEVLEILFAKKEVSPELFFFHFWKQTVYTSSQADQPIELQLLVVEVLASISTREEISPQLQEFNKAIQSEKKPLEFLKLHLLKIEQEDTIKKQIRKSKTITGKEKEPIAEIPKINTPEKETDTPIPNEDLINDIPGIKNESPEANETHLQRSKIFESDNEASEDEKVEETNKPIQSKESPKPDQEIVSEKISQKLRGETDSNKKTSKTIPAKPNILEQLEEGDYLYVQNAGMVLLHPFLKTYFKTLELLEEGQFKDTEAQERAVHLLHYMASGNTAAPEYDLVLPKFLCNLPFNYPVERKVKTNKKEKKEAKKLLQAVINHWGALGQVAPDSLQQGFLQREGKLEKKSGGWYLMIEHKTIDILLDKLPWGISMIKLPWMPEMLKVEWVS